MSASLLLAFALLVSQTFASETNSAVTASQDRVLLADGLYRRGLYRMAEQEYVAVISNTPTAVYWFRLGECRRKLKKDAEAEQAYRRVIELEPASTVAQRALIQRALLAVQRGQHERAQASFAVMTGIRFPPDVRQIAYYHLGECYERTTNITAAVNAYTSSIDVLKTGDYAVFAKARLAWLYAQDRNNVESLRKAEQLQLELATEQDPSIAAPALATAAYLATKPEDAITRYCKLRQNYPESEPAKQAIQPLVALYLQVAQTNKALELLNESVSVLNSSEDISLALTRAILLSRQNQWQLAISAYRDILKQDKENASAQFGLVHALFEVHQDDAVMRTVSQIKNHPRLPDLLWMKAIAASRSGKPDALIVFKRLAHEFPQSQYAPEAFYRVAWLEQEAKHYQEAIKFYSELVRLYPKHPLATKALLASATASQDLDRPSDAIKTLSHLLATYAASSDSKTALYRKALLLIQINDLLAALVALDEFLAHCKEENNYPEALFWRGEVARRLGDTVTAEASFRKALSYNKLSERMVTEIRLALGALLRNQNRDDEAVEFFRPLLTTTTAMKLSSSQLEWLAQYLLNQNYAKDALLAAQRLLECNVNNSSRIILAGETFAGLAQRALKNSDAAMACFQRAIATKQKNDLMAVAELALGELLLERGKNDEALKYFANAASGANQQRQPLTKAKALLGLMRVQRLLGLRQEAIRTAMTLGILFDDPECVSEALDVAATLLEQLGDSAEALRVLDELQERYPHSSAAIKRRGEKR